MIPLTYTPVEELVAFQNKVLARQGQERGPVSSHLSRPAQPDVKETTSMTELRKPSLTAWWQGRLNKAMEKHYPEVIGHWTLVDSWKRDGWNDGTTTLFGVYRYGVKYCMCVFPDYAEPSMVTVTPRFEHTGWNQ